LNKPVLVDREMVFNFETGGELDNDFSSSESDDELETLQDDRCIPERNEEPIPSSTIGNHIDARIQR
jgi:hypothetical protein